jgi:hypothetical protein
MLGPAEGGSTAAESDGFIFGEVERMILELDIWRAPAEIWPEARFFSLGALEVG